MKIAFAQINVTVGDLPGNAAKIASFLAKARRAKAGLVLFPELAVTGYPPEDLLFKPSFIEGNLKVLKRLVLLTRGVTAVIGFVDRDPQGRLYNAAAVAANGRLLAVYHKVHLPNYGVFDEKRYFTPGAKPLVFPPAIGVSICEDIWAEEGPCRQEAWAGAKVLVNISASPYHAGKLRERERLLARRARACQAWICYNNLVGGQDELVFDGGCLLVSPKGQVVFRAPQFTEDLFLASIPSSGKPRRRPLPADGEIFRALVLGTRDYVQKNGFRRVVIGLSGGIDSALTAAVAAAALGRKGVVGVSLPSRFSSAGTRADARAVAKALRIRFLEIPVEPVVAAFSQALRGSFEGRKADATEENLQARIRGTLLMALSNKFGWLVLATGNKSELSTGYCTLYGDMVGGFAVIKDVTKTQVYRVSRAANRHFGRRVIPESVFTRAPTAELKPRQTDQDTLPPYPVLDTIVKDYVEADRPAASIRSRGKAVASVLDRVIRMVDRNEYKRRQAPVGIKITPRAFGRDRRMPITNRFQEI
ncbi:MAG: NAD+ synthase [Candidatus Omnitrophica bacterium]|nr:NAD+ synthase [Candidatus Omnitrophota bacterium]